jgi:hypothetical protein
MQQFTKEKAIALAESGEWKDWTDDEIVKCQLFQEKLCMPFSRFHEAIEKVLGRPVYTHEFGLNYDGLVAEYLGERPAPTFDEIVSLIPKEKLIILSV